MSDGKAGGWLKISTPLIVTLLGILTWPKGYQLPCQLIHKQSPNKPTSQNDQASKPNPYWCYEAAYSYFFDAALGQNVYTYPNSKPKKYSTNDGPNYDLYAQKSMAISTERLVVVAWISLFVGIVGVALVIKTPAKHPLSMFRSRTIFLMKLLIEKTRLDSMAALFGI